MGQARLRGTREERIAQAKKLTTKISRAAPAKKMSILVGSMMFGLLGVAVSIFTMVSQTH